MHPTTPFLRAVASHVSATVRRAAHPLRAIAPVLVLALAVLLPILPASASAQLVTADDVINRYIARVGGMERINAVTSMRRTGKFIGGGGFEARLVQENSRPNKVREEFTLQGMTAINAWDGSVGWKIDPFGGKKDPEALSEDEMHGILLDADFDEPLVNYAAKGHKVQLVGMDQIEGTDVYKLRVAMANGDTRLYYMDKDSFVPIRMEETRVIRGAEQQFETNMGDYKPVAGWLVPFAYETGRKGQDKASITYEKIEANPSVSPSRYAKPGAPSPSAAGGTTPRTAFVPPTVHLAGAVDGMQASMQTLAGAVDGTRMTRISPCPDRGSDAPDVVQVLRTAITTTTTTTTAHSPTTPVPHERALATSSAAKERSASSASSAFISRSATEHRRSGSVTERFASFAFTSAGTMTNRHTNGRTA